MYNHGTVWSVSDLRKLVSLYDDGYTIHSIAFKLGRSDSAVSTRLRMIKQAYLMRYGAPDATMRTKIPYYGDTVGKEEDNLITGHLVSYLKRRADVFVRKPSSSIIGEVKDSFGCTYLIAAEAFRLWMSTDSYKTAMNKLQNESA